MCYIPIPISLIRLIVHLEQITLRFVEVTASETWNHSLYTAKTVVLLLVEYCFLFSLSLCGYK